MAPKNTRTLRYAALTLLVTVLSACGIDEGKVVDSSGSPLSGIAVFIGNKTGQIFQRVTDDEGMFSYENISGPNRMITVDAAGFQQITAKAGSRFTYTLLQDTSSDSDNDGLSDNEELALGTSPYNPDSDGDGLPDSIESRVMFPVPLVAMGATPLHKDMFIEVDWDGSRPETKFTDVAVGLLKLAFRNAPIENPDGTTGIRVFVDQGAFGGGSGEDQLLASSRLNIFYHTDTSSDLNSLFGFADLPGRNHWVQGDFSGFGIGEGFVEAIVWMHELGHNLGLRHGGDDDIVCKPNYPSVMNYNPFMALSFSYSQGLLADLDERWLDEREGIGFGAVDWNDNYRFDDELVEADIDGHTPINIIQWLLNGIDVSVLPSDLAGALSQERCIPGYYTPYHRDHNDWAVIEAGLDDDLDYVMQRLSKAGLVEDESPALKGYERVMDTFEFPPSFQQILNQRGLLK